MKNNLRNNKGITLIALIITIIILLILATVSIKLLVDQGIIGRSQNATSKYVIEEEKEKINLAYADYKMEKAENGSGTLTVEGATVSGDETSGWTITFTKTGNRYKFDPSQGEPELKPKTEEEKLLERYFLGENGETKLLSDVMDMENMTFKDVEGAVIPEGSTKFAFINITNDTEHGYVIFKYENKAYRLQCDINTMENQAVEFVYAPTGREGQTIPYSIDGTEANKKDWTVLYDYGNGVVEIVSPDAMGSLTLGFSDEEAQNPGDIDKNGKANEPVDKAIYSYNNAVTRLNAYASSLVTNTNKISVRSVGSNPYNPNAESEMYKSERLAEWLDGRYNGIGRGSDVNSEQDLIRMSYYGLASTGSSYWLASRFVDETLGGVNFYVDYVGGGGSSYNDYLWDVRESGAYGYGNGNSCAVRPVVKINS